MMRIKPQEATLGMYIQGFDGSWLSHPFWRTHFLIETEEQLARIRGCGSDVFIDPTQGTVPVRGQPEQAVVPRSRPVPSISIAPLTSARLPRLIQPARRIVAPPAFGKADKVRAIALTQRSTKVVKALFDDCRLGRAIAMPQILEVVDDIAEMLERTGTAFASVTRLKAKDDYTFTHSVAVCALMINLARETGASSPEAHDLGMAGLLHDIGKLKIDDAILSKPADLTQSERNQLLKHPELGHEMLRGETGLPAVALDVCLHHHERLNGSGYPYGLRDGAITKAARMSAICDVYDATTSDRPYKKGKSPVEAISEMESMSGHFDSDLLFRFMRSIGVFPPRKLLRLRSNRLAIALPPAYADRKPTARAFYSTIGTQFIDYEDVVIGDRLNDEQAVSQEEPAAWFSGDWRTMGNKIAAGQPCHV